MPELPDIAAYISALEPRIIGQPLQRIRLASPFLLRINANPRWQARMGERWKNCAGSASALPSEWGAICALVLHLMIAGAAALAASRRRSWPVVWSLCSFRLPPVARRW